MGRTIPPRTVDLGRLIGGPYHRQRYVVDAAQDRIVIARPTSPYWAEDLNPRAEVGIASDHYRRERMTAPGATYAVAAFVHESMTLEEATGPAFDLLVELALEPVLLEGRAGESMVLRVPVDVDVRIAGAELEAGRALGEAAAGRAASWVRAHNDKLNELNLAGRL